MNNSLRAKLVLSYLTIALLTAAFIFLLIRLTSNQRLEQFVLEQELSELHDEVASWYEIERDWDGFRQYFLALHPPPPRSQSADGEARNGGRSSRGNHGIVDAELRLLNNYLNFDRGEFLPEALLVDGMPVIVEGETIAWIVPDDATGISLQSEEQVFLESTNRILLIASSAAVGASLLIGFGLASVIIRPIRALTLASEQMAQGKLKQQVEIGSKDEIGRLATSFNSMSHEITLADERRRQLTANIAHDLGTPVHIALGYLEMIQSGTRPATAEQLTVIESELNHLKRLIKDLDVLAQADTKTLHLDIAPVSLQETLSYVIASFTPIAEEQSLELILKPLPQALPAIKADDERLVQVLGNIVSNGIRFTPAGGTVELSAEQVGSSVCIYVRDNGAGIAPESLPYVFDRFYQADQSRGRSGKMGLGLAISKELVEAMGGKITAESSVNQGTTITICVPSF